MSSLEGSLRIPADFLREARRLFGRLQLPGRTAHGIGCPVEACGSFDGITLAAGDRRCRLETFRPAMAEAGGRGHLLLTRRTLA